MLYQPVQMQMRPVWHFWQTMPVRLRYCFLTVASVSLAQTSAISAPLQTLFPLLVPFISPIERLVNTWRLTLECAFNHWRMSLGLTKKMNHILLIPFAFARTLSSGFCKPEMGLRNVLHRTCTPFFSPWCFHQPWCLYLLYHIQLWPKVMANFWKWVSLLFIYERSI